MYQGPHGIQGGAGTVPGGATPPTLNAAGQALLASMSQGPVFRAHSSLPFWQQIGMSAAPTGPAGGASAGAGWAITGSSHPPLNNVNSTGTAAPPHPGPPGGRNWFGPPGTNGDPYGPPTQAPPSGNPLYNHFYNYIMQRWPGWNNGPPPPAWE